MKAIILALLALLALTSVVASPPATVKFYIGTNGEKRDVTTVMEGMCKMMLLGCSISCSCILFSLSLSGIDFIQTLINPIIEKDLSNVPLPDEHFKAPLGIRVDLTEILLTDVTFTSQAISTIQPSSLGIDFNDIQGHISLKWHYKGLLIKFGGTMDISFSKTSIGAVLDFQADGTGRPAITLSSLKVKIDDLDIKVHGGGGGFWE